MSSLADRIRANGARPWHFLDWPKRTDDWPEGESMPPRDQFPSTSTSFDPTLLDDTFIVDATDAADFIGDCDPTLEWRDIVTTVAAPFPRLFFEFRPRSQHPAWAGLTSWGTLVEQIEFDSDTFDDPDAPRWGLQLTHVFEARKHDVFGPVGTARHFVMPDGRLEAHPTGTVKGGIAWIPQEPNWLTPERPDTYTEGLELAVWQLGLPTLFALSLMHCRNVEARPIAVPPKLQRARIRRGHPALVKYHVLELDPMRTVLESEGRARSDGLAPALHRCRGHFKTYGPGAPLFGRFTGQWWWNEHQRGDAKHGEVAKDYRLQLSPLGRGYQLANEIARAAEGVTHLDPDRSARGAAAHAQVQNATALLLEQLGIDPRSPGRDEPPYDIAFMSSGRIWVIEVKSLTPENEERQLRTALGQVLRYRQALLGVHPDVRAAVVVEQVPLDESWLELFHNEGICLSWPDEFLSLRSEL